MAVRAPIGRSPGQEWQYEISTVSAHIGRSPVHELQYEISTVRAHIGRSSGRSTLPPLEASSAQE